MKKENLNFLTIPCADGGDMPTGDLLDYSCSSGPVKVYFKNLPDRLIELISPKTYIVGCVAWLTHKDILEAMSRCRGVSIIVQKEDFLRPDSRQQRGLKELYKNLPSRICRQEDFARDSLLSSLSICAGWEPMDSVRCVGICNNDKKLATPRAHHKFVVFCKREIQQTPPFANWSEGDGEEGPLIPEKVWTGSFNFIHNGENSFENAVVIENKEIAEAYFKEYQQVAALSEPLNWEQSWVAPEWRIGT